MAKWYVDVPTGYKSVGGSKSFYSKHYRDIRTGELRYSFFDASPLTSSSRRVLSGVSEETGSMIIENFEQSRHRFRAVNTAYLSSLQGKSELRRRTFEGIDKAFRTEYSGAETRALEDIFSYFELEDWNDFVKSTGSDEYFTDWWAFYHRYEINRKDSGAYDIEGTGKAVREVPARELAEKMIDYLASIGKLPAGYNMDVWELSLRMYETGYE